jgi:hypothetical protein
LKTLQRTAQDESSSLEITILKDCLQRKTGEFECKKEGFAELEQECVRLKKINADLQDLCDEKESKIIQHPAIVESLRQENEVEREDLRIQNSELKAAKHASEVQLRRVQEEKNELTRRCEEDLDGWQRRHERSDAALKEAEAKIQLQKTECYKKIEFDRQKYEAIVQAVTEELSKLKAQVSESHSFEKQAAQLTAQQGEPSNSLQNQQAGKNRKRVNRENHSVLDVTKLSKAHKNISIRHRPTSNRKPTQENTEDADLNANLFDEEPQGEGLPIMEPVSEQIDDTQETTGPLMPTFDGKADITSQELLQGSKQLLPISEQSSLLGFLDLNDINSLFEDHPKTPMAQDYTGNSNIQRISQPRTTDTQMFSDPVSIASFPSPDPKDRPRSQANTASRMMPPPGNMSNSLDKGKPSPILERQHTTRNSGHSKPGHTLRNSDKTDLDFAIHSKGSPESIGHHRQLSKYSQNSEYTSNQKRKNSKGRDVSFKRQRTSSRSYAATSSPGSQQESPYLAKRAVGGTRSRPQLPLLQVSASPSAITRSRGQLGSPRAAPRTIGQASSSSQVSQSRSQRCSTPRDSAAARTPRISNDRQSKFSHQPTSSRQTRSKSKSKAKLPSFL